MSFNLRSNDPNTYKSPGHRIGGQPLSDPVVKKPLVLVVENHEDTRLMLRTLLEMKGCRVAEAGDGLEAVEIANRESPELILMDGVLPFLDGLSATRLIRKQNLRKIKIVAISGDPRPSFHAAALAAGCDDFLIKPIDFFRLNNILGSLLDTSAIAA
jgi:CheY-like chemotaxis protein